MQGAPNVNEYLPHRDAAIQFSDFGTVAELAAYIKLASQNETLYEKHMAWRQLPFAEGFLSRLHHGLSPYCQLCDQIAASNLAGLGQAVPSTMPAKQRFNLAISNGDQQEVLEILSKAKAGPPPLDAQQQALQEARMVGTQKLAVKILEYGEHFDAPEVHVMSEKILQEHGLVIAGIIFQHGQAEPSATQQKLLFKAVTHGDSHQERLKGVQELLNANSDETSVDYFVNGADPQEGHAMSQLSPLHLAAQSKMPHIAQILIEHGANVNAVDVWNDTALQTACAFGSYLVAKVLLAHGAKDGPGCAAGPGCAGHAGWTSVCGRWDGSEEGEVDDPTDPHNFTKLLMLGLRGASQQSHALDELAAKRAKRHAELAAASKLLSAQRRQH